MEILQEMMRATGIRKILAVAGRFYFNFLFVSRISENFFYLTIYCHPEFVVKLLILRQIPFLQFLQYFKTKMQTT